AAFAEFEREVRRERQAAGIAVARKRGVYVGRRPGTTKAKPARALKLRKKGLTVSEIATALGVSRHTLFLYLRKFRPTAGASPPAAGGRGHSRNRPPPPPRARRRARAISPAPPTEKHRVSHSPPDRNGIRYCIVHCLTMYYGGSLLGDGAPRLPPRGIRWSHAA